MSESEPTEHRREPLRRFESDLQYAGSFFDLMNAFMTYLAGQFDISEDAAMQLYSEATKKLPGVMDFEENVGLAHEQMRLGLVRIVLPIAERLIESDEDFQTWLSDAASVAIDIGGGTHKLAACLGARQDRAALDCKIGAECPVRVVKYELIKDGIAPDFSSDAYQGPWATQKVERTHSKLVVAENLGLLSGHESGALRSIYKYRARVHGLHTPETGNS